MDTQISNQGSRIRQMQPKAEYYDIMPDFSPDEINLISINNNWEKKKLIKQLTKMLDDAEDDE